MSGLITEERSVSDPLNGMLIDVGNTSIKYAFITDGNDLSPVKVAKDSQEVLEVIEANAGYAIWISSVGHKRIAGQLENAAIEAESPVYIARSQSSQLGVSCAYANVDNLGVDRWLAILAADELTSLPYAVLDLGTAMTCDVVVDKQHVGGWIAPGFQVMRNALIENTTFVFADNDNPEVSDMGKDTPECVNHGCLAAAQGFILSAESYLSARFDDYRLIIAGGNKAIAQQMMGDRYMVVDNLVLSGLLRLAKSS